MSTREILKQYWGHEQFRPLQEDIINSVLNGRDTLALLPTGGGKSVCFQVPALAKEGICIVISPLIALMKDQVENLNKRGIKAISITSGIGKRELDIALDNCVYGDIKFLYLSPERLQSELVQERIKRMNVNLLAVDEAHCISQWGYDFRPPYLQIAEIRKLIPDVPVLALTATATLKVRDDIQERLLFRKKNIFKKSFERKNLVYLVLNEEDKLKRLLKILNKEKGTGVVYVRNRKQTQEIAGFLQKNKIVADFYHAGLDAKIRSEKQEDWINNRCRIIVATNAFGMGIDKPDVRVVVHMDLPESLEAYYQEAGRGGRDEKKAYAVLLYSPSDKLELEQKSLNEFPSVKEIKEVYHALGSYYRIAFGAGNGLSFDFDIADFCKQYKLSPVKTLNALKFMEKDELIVLSEEVFLPSRLMFLTGSSDLYSFMIANEKYEAFIKLILRSYGGVFDQYVKINEKELARRSSINAEEVKELLGKLHQMDIIEYLPAKNKPQLQFLTERLPESNLRINASYIKERKLIMEEKIHAILQYAGSSHECRSVLLLKYFGETGVKPCGTCDVCLERRKKVLTDKDRKQLFTEVLSLVKNENLSLPQVLHRLDHIPETKIVETIRFYVDEGLIQLNDKNEVIIVNHNLN
jgi:ATP-dependent DNA helicase RecQ